MPFKPGQLENLLINKFGFSPAKGHSSDHRWFELSLPGLPPIFTKISHNKKDIWPGLESKIARQLHVRRAYFQDMFACKINRKEYYRQLRENPYPPFGVRF